MGRPTNSEKEEGNFLKEQCQGLDQAINQAEKVLGFGREATVKPEEIVGALSYLLGSIKVRVQNIENKLKVYG